MDGPHGIRFVGTGFYVIHRQEAYGPFDYQWSPDMDGLELHYLGQKFGEICSPVEIQADLKEFRLPTRVVQVATIVLGTLLEGMLRGLPEEERHVRVWAQLSEAGCARFLPDDLRTEGLSEDELS